MTPKHDTLLDLSRPERFALLAIFIGLLTLPWIAGVLGVRPNTVENRSLASLPELSLSSVFDEAFWSEVDTFLTDHTPLRQEAIRTLADIQEFAGVAASTDVFRGNGEVLFLAEEFTEACAYDYDPADLAAAFSDWLGIAQEHEKGFVFVVAPDKASVLTDSYGPREVAAAPCAEDRRQTVVAEFASLENSPFLPLWQEMRSANETSAEPMYYVNDSHWTFHGAAVFAQALVERLDPGLTHADHIQEGDPYTVRGDAARRLGRLETEIMPALRSDLPGVTTQLSELDVNGTRTVRTYTSHSTGDLKLIPGNTVVLHDSFMNFAEALLAPYFESITFVHWHDTTKASFFNMVAEADRVIIEVVERNLHLRAAQTFLTDGFNDPLTRGLTGEGVDVGAISAEELIPALETRSNALESFIMDTGTRPTAFADLVSNPGFDTWAGPYVDSGIDDPIYGEWRIIDGVNRNHDGGLVRCEIEQEGCGLWLLLTDVPRSLVQSLDSLLDGDDGLNSGDIRLSSQHGILYYWVTS